MAKTVLLRRQQVHGNVNRMIRATVLSESKDELRVVLDGSKSVIVVKASECVDAPAVFGTRLAMQQGVVIQKALPDSPGCLARILENR